MPGVRYTPQRHRLLAEVKAGGMKVYMGFGWNLLRGDEFILGGASRTALAIRPYIRTATARRNVSLRAMLTEEGDAVLARWNNKYGDALPIPTPKT